MRHDLSASCGRFTSLSAFMAAAAAIAGLPVDMARAANVTEVEANNTLGTAQVIGAGSFTLDDSPNIGDTRGTNASLDIWHASISGTGNGTFDYYRFDARAGWAMFDIDGATFDTEIAVFNSAGVPLAENDDEFNTLAGAGGSTSSLDSWLQFKLPSTGTYYVGVARWSAGATTGGWSSESFLPPSGGAYTLHVSSIQAAAVATTWNDSAGGNWHDSGNWSAGRPLIHETAYFDLNNTYTTSFTHDAHVDLVQSDRGIVTLDLNGHSLTTYAGLRIGMTNAVTSSTDEIRITDGTVRETDGRVSVGYSHWGRLRVSDGGRLEAQNLNIGDETGGRGIVNVTGASASMSVGYLAMGDAGSVGATLWVEDGATVQTTDTAVGFSPSPASTQGMFVDISGGSNWTNSRHFVIGGHYQPGNGTFVAGRHGVAQVDGATLNVNGTIKVFDLPFDQANGLFSYLGLYGGGTIRTHTLDLSGNVNNLAWYDGTIELAGGSITNLGPSALTVPADGILAGVGSVAGSVVNEGTIAPGLSPGRLSITGNISTTGTLAFEIAGTAESFFDRIDATGTVSLGGTIKLALIGGFVPDEGDSFDLMDFTGIAGGSPLFDFADAMLPAGLGWDTSSFLQTGTVGVVAVPEPAALGAASLLLGALLLRRRRGREA